MIREAFQDLARLRQIAAAVARHGFGAVLTRSKLAEHADASGMPASPELLRQSAAARFRALLSELGPTFVKLGQTLSTRPDLLPAELVAELSQLQDRAPPMRLEEVTAQIESSLGKPVGALFKAIDHNPLASASIAQAHLATTLEGEEVVVKVQRPNLLHSIRADLDLLEYLAIALEAIFEEAGIYAPRGIVEEFDRTLHEELDFEREAQNLREFGKNHADRPYVRIPRLYENLSSPVVLTMERLHGVKITEADYTVHSRKEVITHLVETSFHQLFDDGFFHGDPHPGNVWVINGPGEVIGILDFGLVGRVTRQMQESIITLVMSVALKDADTAARLFSRLGTGEQRTNLTAFRDEIAAILDRYLGSGTLKDINSESLMRDLLDLAVRYRIRVPKEYAVLSRATSMVEGIIREVYPDMNVMEVAGPYAKRLLRDRLDPNDLQGNVMKVALRLQNFATEVPLQLSQILLDLETGKLSVGVRSEGLESITRVLRSLAVILPLSMLSAAFVVGGFISFARFDREIHGWPLSGLIAVMMAGALAGAGITSYLLGGRLVKIRLSRWLRK